MRLLTGYLKLKLMPRYKHFLLMYCNVTKNSNYICRVTKCTVTQCVIHVTKSGRKEHSVRSAMEFLEDLNIKLSQGKIDT